MPGTYGGIYLQSWYLVGRGRKISMSSSLTRGAQLHSVSKKKNQKQTNKMSCLYLQHQYYIYKKNYSEMKIIARKTLAGLLLLKPSFFFSFRTSNKLWLDLQTKNLVKTKQLIQKTHIVKILSSSTLLLPFLMLYSKEAAPINIP